MNVFPKSRGGLFWSTIKIWLIVICLKRVYPLNQYTQSTQCTIRDAIMHHGCNSSLQKHPSQWSIQAIKEMLVIHRHQHDLLHSSYIVELLGVVLTKTILNSMVHITIKCPKQLWVQNWQLHILLIPDKIWWKICIYIFYSICIMEKIHWLHFLNMATLDRTT